MKKYCLDTNVFIEAWNRYYSMELCPQYWRILDDLAQQRRIFAPIEVKREIEKSDDGLHEWLRKRPYFFRDIDLRVQRELRRIMASHGRLVDDNVHDIVDKFNIQDIVDKRSLTIE